MTQYLLDTNACIALINARPPIVRERFKQAEKAGDSFAVSSLVVFELRYGAAKSRSPDSSNAQVDVFLAGALELLTFDELDAAQAGVLRADLERRGTPIGAYEVLIAAQAVRRSCTVVTANVSEFDRVTGLSSQDWSASPEI